jgi:long-chain-fatty-acid--CoA ligase ACSBG
MMSHDNLTWMARTASKFLNMTANDSVVSYLPLSHSAAQMVDVWMTMSAGGTVNFADRNALKGSLVSTLREVRPTLFLGVPRVFEKMMEKMQELGKSAPAVKRLVANWAKKTGLDRNKKKLVAQASGASASAVGNDLQYKWAKKLVFDKVKNNLGLDNTKSIGVGAAPIAMDSLEYFLSLDIPLLECYGMSETGGPHTGNRPGHHRLGSIGPSIGGCRTKILNADADGEGELCMSSRNIMMGYLFNEEKTKEAIDDDGWLHSGDLGTELEDGYFKVTGRLKELIITAGGENVAPIPIEDTVKKELECVANAMVVGDRKKFLSCLLTLKVVTDPDTMEPKEELSSAAKDWCQEAAGVKITTLAEVLTPGSEHEKIMRAIQEGIDKVNGQSVSNAQKIQKWTILPTDFSVPGDELGPTLKLKRHTVVKKYAAYIESLYDV